MIDTWEYVDDRLIPHLAPWRASLFTIGNGFLGTRGTLEEGYEGQEPATFIHGLFVTPPGDLPVLAAVPDWTRVEISVDGEPFRLDRRPAAGIERRLDFRTGVLTRTVVWKGAESGAVKAVFRRTASMAEPTLVALDITFTALTDPVTIEIATGIDAAVEGPFGALWKTTKWDQLDSDALSLSARSIDSAHDISVVARLTGLERPELVRDSSRPRFTGSFRLEPGASHTITKVVRYSIPDQAEPSLPARGVSFDDVLADSLPQWNRRWRTSRIDVGGDAVAEQALRFAAFHLIAAAPPRQTSGSIGARLLSGYGYRHHIFWDTDIFVVPYLTLTQPDLAVNHLHYRYAGLEGARRKAAHFGRKGAFYAWEAVDTGDEVAPQWGVMPDGSPIRIWTGELEEHITACVAWATDHYHRWTGDDDFLAAKGAEMILDGAKYWANRLELNNGAAHLSNVVGPNEYHVQVKDNFFTNAMAAWQLRRAASVAAWLRDRDVAAGDELLEALQLAENGFDEYPKLADSVVVNRSPAGVFEESAGFFDLEPIDVSAFYPSRVSLHGILGDDRTRSVQLVKQADVLMALVLLDDYRTDREALAANFDYYAPKTDHGSSLSLAMHSLAASMIGRPDEAYHYFRRVVAIDHSDAMVRGGHGIHAAAQGGILQATLQGFGGLRLADGRPVTSSHLPDHWNSLGFSFVYHGEVIEREVTRDSRPPGRGRKGREERQ